MKTLWKTPQFGEELAAHLETELGIPLILCQLLVQRNITTVEAATEFLNPHLVDLHDPFLMLDMDKAVQRLDTAILNEEKILLYGDYDVDGTTCVAMMFSYLHNLHPHLDYYIPDRDKEGYGVSLLGVEYARVQNCKLVIAMDCGIKANEAVALANSYGIDFIVCDHHLPEGDLPEALAILDPKRPDCPYPYKELSGCGVAFKLAQAYAQRQNVPVEEIDYLLDLVATSIACDIVPMTGENRVLAHFGLQKINHAPRVGIWALIQKSGRKFPMNISDLVFGLGPLINASGRLGDARQTVKMLLASDKQSALDNAASIVQRNKERREIDSKMAEQARLQWKKTEDIDNKSSIVLYQPNWHKGIIGIVASRLSDEFHKPTVILTLSEGRAVGSARSIPGFDLYEALQACGDLFYNFGGHAHAAGLQMPVENVAIFRERFDALVRDNNQLTTPLPVLEISADLDIETITLDFWQQLKRFAPFGPHNQNPIFKTSNAEDTGNSRLLENNHARFSLKQAHAKKTISGIGFGMGQLITELKGKDAPFEVAYNIQEGIWRGEMQLSLQIKDLKWKEEGET
jgi:single-stranded-DNA-specific exonuclease